VSEHKKRTTQRLKKKHCAFPGCDVIFIGRGKAKYCDEHRKAKYRKELYKKNDNDGEANIRIEHNEIYATTELKTCALDGCDNTFEILLVPRIFEYPRYCEEHRNPYKRNTYIKQQQNKSDDD